jgi:Domain of unknown function (DUF4145)
MSRAVNSPSIRKKAFDCPKCGAFADQTWYDVYSKKIWRKDDDNNLPYVATPAWFERISAEQAAEYDDEKKIPKEMLDILKRQTTGEVYLDGSSEHKSVERVNNLNLSQCRSCKGYSLWRQEQVIYPNSKFKLEPNIDLAEDIKQDFNEACAVLETSARSAAALLRLCIQKLCKQLGLPGKDLNKDISELVKRGINAKVQRALDIVRVIGNESVHPGTIDLRDNRETAEQLFQLVNMIAFDMITHPKELDKLYSELPEAKRKAIEERDKNP